MAVAIKACRACLSIHQDNRPLDAQGFCPACQWIENNKATLDLIEETEGRSHDSEEA